MGCSHLCELHRGRLHLFDATLDVGGDRGRHVLQLASDGPQRGERSTCLQHTRPWSEVAGDADRATP